MIATLQGYLDTGRQIALEWITSPAAYAQFGLLVAAYLLAVVANAWLRPKLSGLLTPAEGDAGNVARARRFVLMFLPILLPLLAYAFTAAGEQVTRSIFGSGAVIAFGKRLFIFLVVRRVVMEIVTDPFLKTLGRYIAIPLAALYVVGLLTPLSLYLEETRIGCGDQRELRDVPDVAISVDATAGRAGDRIW